MSNINDLITEIEPQIITYNLKADIQSNKTDVCYEDNTLSYANWILGLHKDTSNTTKTVYLYTNVCEKNGRMYEEYLLLRPDKEIDDDGKTLRTHMKEKYEEDKRELENNKKLLEKGRDELSRLQTEFNENETLRENKANTLKEIQNKVEGEQQELTDKKTILKNERLEDKLNEIKTELSKQEGELREKEGELREKEEQRDNIMNSLKNIQGGVDDDDDEQGYIRTAETLPDTDDITEGVAQETNDNTNDDTKEMEQDTESDDQRTVLLNEEIEELNQEIKPLQLKVNTIQSNVSNLEQQFTQINNRIQELGIATLEQTITEELESIQTLTQELRELNKQGVLINNDISRLDPMVSQLGQAIEAHKDNFDNKPNKLYEIEIKDFGNNLVKAVNVLNADYIDIGLLYEDVAYMVGKKSTEPPAPNPVMVRESDSTKSLPAAQQPVIVRESTSDSDSDTGSDNVSISDVDILTANIDETLTEGFMTDNVSPQKQDKTLTPSNTSTNNDTFEINKTDILTPDKQSLLLEEVNIDDTTPLLDNPAVISSNSDIDSDSDSDSDVNIKTSDIVTRDEQGLFNDSLSELPDTDTILQQDQLELPTDIINVPNEDEDEDEEYDEESFFHDAPPPLIENLQFIEDKFNAYDDTDGIKDRTVDAVKGFLKDDILGPFQEIYTTAGVGNMKAPLIINKLSNAIQKRDINTFLKMISDMKTSLNGYYDTTDSNEQEEILEQLVKSFKEKFPKYSGGSVKKQKTKKQKPLRKNNSFRKKRRAKV